MKSIVKIIGEDYFLSALPKSYKKVEPLAVRGVLPTCRINCELGIWQQLPSRLEHAGTFYLHQLLQDGPLVISTYSPAWNEYGKEHLQALNKLYPQLHKLGANLLLLSTEYFKNIIYTVQEFNVSYNVLQDHENRISEVLGVYSEYEPVWDSIAGITEDVPFPATFVIGTDRRVLYSFVSKDFEYLVPTKEIEKILAFVKKQSVDSLNF